VTWAAASSPARSEGERRQRELGPAVGLHSVVPGLELGIGGVERDLAERAHVMILDGADAVSSGTSSLVNSTGAR